MNKKTVFSWLYILAGTGFMAFAVLSFYDPIGLVTGGFTGVAIMVRRMSAGLLKGGIPIWFTNLILNIPLFLIAYRRNGWRFIGRTAFAAVSLSFWLGVLPECDLAGGDFLLASVYGGVLTGAGIGLVLGAGVATGGTDLIATLLHPRLRIYSVAQILQVIDGLIILAGIYVCGIRASLYAVFAVIVTTRVSDLITEGGRFSRAVYVISDRYEDIAGMVLHQLNRGTTAIPAVGMYRNTERRILFCVVSKKEVVPLKDFIRSIDAHAFVIVTDAREVLGEGFIADTDNL